MTNKILAVFAALSFALSGCQLDFDTAHNMTVDTSHINTIVFEQTVVSDAPSHDYDTAYDLDIVYDDNENKLYAVIGDNTPDFEDFDTLEEFEIYSELDELGRCGPAFANICLNLMPTEERGEIGSIKPTGWHSVKYPCIDGKYLYNRCHLIGYQLAGENANEKNLITGTRYLNVKAMLPFENLIADYVKETENHVLYRVTPVFENDNLIADGVRMEAWSVEDNGDGVCFDVFCYNIQPDIFIDYATGESQLE